MNLKKELGWSRILFDFEITKYFLDNRNIIATINYFRQSRGINKKQIQKDNKISHATFRRAELNYFVDHPELIKKMATYFQIPTDYKEGIVQEANSHFNLLYTYLNLGDFEKMEYHYKQIELIKMTYPNSFFLAIFHFARLVYYVGSPLRVELNAIKESIEVLQLFRDDLLDVFIFLLDYYLLCYYSLMHDKINTTIYAKKIYLESAKYPSLLPLVLYQLSLNYYFINDYANSIFYSLEVLPMLENELNYNRALYCNLNIAICFERLNNTVKSKELLDRIFLYLMANHVPRVAYLAKLTLANCYISEENYVEAIPIFEELEMDRPSRGENSLMLLYCFYKTKEEHLFNALKDTIDEEVEKDNFYLGYYDVVLLLAELFNQNKKNILSKFKIAEKSFQAYGDSKIVDLLYKELSDRKIISVS